jgi:hypothetical protein
MKHDCLLQKRNFILISILIFFSRCHAQDYDQYFLNRVVVDSLVRSGRYEVALKNMRQCIRVPEMVTVSDEFFLGYAYFKTGNIDSASLFMNKAVKEGFHFHKMVYVDDWREKGVFDKFIKVESLKSIPQLLTKNTLDYENQKPSNLVLAGALTDARKLDQQYRHGEISDSLLAKQTRLDKKNQEFLNKIIQQYGWPSEKLVGYEGSNSAFLIAQHADLDTSFQHLCLRHIQLAFYHEEINSADYAYIIDRVRVNSNRQQIFGTQFLTISEKGKMKLKLKPVAAVRYVDLRRRILGLPPVDQYLSSSTERIIGQMRHQ